MHPGRVRTTGRRWRRIGWRPATFLRGELLVYADWSGAFAREPHRRHLARQPQRCHRLPGDPPRAHQGTPSSQRRRCPSRRGLCQSSCPRGGRADHPRPQLPMVPTASTRLEEWAVLKGSRCRNDAVTQITRGVAVLHTRGIEAPTSAWAPGLPRGETGPVALRGCAWGFSTQPSTLDRPSFELSRPSAPAAFLVVGAIGDRGVLSSHVLARWGLSRIGRERASVSGRGRLDPPSPGPDQAALPAAQHLAGDRVLPRRRLHELRGSPIHPAFADVDRLGCAKALRRLTGVERESATGFEARRIETELVGSSEDEGLHVGA